MMLIYDLIHFRHRLSSRKVNDYVFLQLWKKQTADLEKFFHSNILEL